MNPSVTWLRPQDLGAQFVLDPATHKFRHNPVSVDPGQVLSQGSDLNAFLNALGVQNAQTTYHLALAGHTIQLYRTASGVTTLQDTVDTTLFDMSVSGATIINGILSLTETNGGPTVQVDLSAFLKAVSYANSNAIAITGQGNPGSPLVVSFVVDATVPAVTGAAGNLLKVSVNGAKVDPSDVLALLNANISHTLVVDTANALLRSVVNGIGATVPLTEILDVTGVHQGWMLT